MHKEEIDLIHLKIILKEEIALHMQIYRSGLIYRSGVGATPEIHISAWSTFGKETFFIPILEKIPEQLLKEPCRYEETTPNGLLEYSLSFYSGCTNGETGDKATWAQSHHLHFLLDLNTKYRNPLIGLVDKFILDASEITNDWYFDVIVKAKFSMQSQMLPENTIITQPQNDKALEIDYAHYINEMIRSIRKWDLSPLTKGKLYMKDGAMYEAVIRQDSGSLMIRFDEKEERKQKMQPNSPWWKFWVTGN